MKFKKALVVILALAMVVTLMPTSLSVKLL